MVEKEANNLKNPPRSFPIPPNSRGAVLGSRGSALHALQDETFCIPTVDGEVMRIVGASENVRLCADRVVKDLRGKGWPMFSLPQKVEQELGLVQPGHSEPRQSQRSETEHQPAIYTRREDRRDGSRQGNPWG